MTVARTGAHQCTVSDSVAVNSSSNSDVDGGVDADVDFSAAATFVAVCCCWERAHCMPVFSASISLLCRYGHMYVCM